jgi:hypothetical protein
MFSGALSWEEERKVEIIEEDEEGGSLEWSRPGLTPTVSVTQTSHDWEELVEFEKLGGTGSPTPWPSTLSILWLQAFLSATPIVSTTNSVKSSSPSTVPHLGQSQLFSKCLHVQGSQKTQSQAV